MNGQRSMWNEAKSYFCQTGIWMLYLDFEKRIVLVEVKGYMRLAKINYTITLDQSQALFVEALN